MHERNRELANRKKIVKQQARQYGLLFYVLFSLFLFQFRSDFALLFLHDFYIFTHSFIPFLSAFFHSVSNETITHFEIMLFILLIFTWWILHKSFSCSVIRIHCFVCIQIKCWKLLTELNVQNTSFANKRAQNHSQNNKN